jgi:1-deoxy-D-xylulose-5-phosphate reductoisomerase
MKARCWIQRFPFSAPRVDRNQYSEVVERFPERFRVVGLAAGRQTDRLLEQIARYRPRVVSLSADAPAEDRARVRSEFPEVQVLQGIEGMIEVATHPDCDFVMSATVGAVGLVPTLRAIEAGKNVGLANKETLVMAGELMTRAVVTWGNAPSRRQLEHNAVHQCPTAGSTTSSESGSRLPEDSFRLSSLEDMRRATKAEALKHPTWNMGRKISIDSATMMNKGWRSSRRIGFGVPADRVRWWSIPVHDSPWWSSRTVAQHCGGDRVRLPIQYALTYPERVESRPSAARPRLPHEPRSIRRTTNAFGNRACLPRARRGQAPATLNAANEVAVDAILHDRIGFLSIAEIRGDAVAD